jgi:ATP-dependent Zn protease
VCQHDATDATCRRILPLLADLEEKVAAHRESHRTADAELLDVLNAHADAAAQKERSERVDPRYALAVHEAGHAVVAMLKHVPITAVTIRSTAAAQGMAIYTLEYAQSVVLAFEEGSEWAGFSVAAPGIMVSLAGRLAEEVFFGSPQHSPVAYAHDEDGITELVARLCFGPDEGDALVDWLTIRTRRLVEARRDQIESVARTLLERESMDGDDVYKAMKAAAPCAGARSRLTRPRKGADT